MSRIMRRTSTIILTVLAMVLAMVATSLGTGAAVAATPPDQSKVPHYFGPWPNWANSPFTLSKASVSFTGTGSEATAVAQVDPVDPNGIKSVDITNPGRGYTNGTTVSISGGTTAATGTVTVSSSKVVTGFTSVVPGSGYTAFKVALTGGGGSGATAIGSGGVDAVKVTAAGSGYTAPTVDFDYPDDPNGVQATGHAVCNEAPGDCTHAANATVSIKGIEVDNPGSGYAGAPGVAILNGTANDPINLPANGVQASATSTVSLTAVNVDQFGSGYTTAPTVTITDPKGTGTGASATAITDGGAITSVTITNHGAGYLNKGMRKFVDNLPNMCTPPACPDFKNPANAKAKYIPAAVPAQKKYNGVMADEYVIGLVQYRTSFSSDLPNTLVRGYVQIETPDNAAISQHFPLVNANLDPTKPGTAVMINGFQAYGVTPPQYLGPIVSATKDKPVRTTFRNLLPTGSGGDLFLPVDSSMMGSGNTPTAMMDPADQKSTTDGVRNPACTQTPKPTNCYKDDRALLHFHGGITPWISDGTPHQWITPANETTAYPQGVSVKNVPDMQTGGIVNCDSATDGCQTYYYTNQQSARMMWIHDHAWGITRLNVYAGEATGYLLADDTEKRLIADGVIPGAADTLPLIIQDKTFVPGDEQLKDTVVNGETTSYGQDPTWDSARWGGKGSLWYHHVYMPAQNPGDASGMSAYGRWMYGPWFWPPATDTTYGPIPNPYYDAKCNIDDPSTWTYQTDPYCEPQQIPGTPNISAGMEQFNDTPLVNGVAYPKVTVQPKAYRLRMLNASNDRFFNLQWYTADPTQGDGTTEVALKPAELAAAQTDPNAFPTPVDSNNPNAGPSWVQIANEGGFLPTPTVIDGQQPMTWIVDPTRFDFGNADKHSMLIAPAERADAVVDFSKFAGKTLIMYNDAPAAYPARVSTYDYYTGAPDLSPVGAPQIFPGYGPNTRTVMQVTVANATPAPAFDVAKLKAAFTHKANLSGAYEASQPAPIVGQATYNSALGTSFAATGECKNPNVTKCDGLVRVDDSQTFTFNTVKSPTTKTTLPVQPKAIHDETNSTTFDPYGRMQATLGVEAQPPTPGGQNVTLYPYTNPQTELIDGTNLPKQMVTYDATTGLPTSDVKITPISDAKDGTQLWRITHNGVDTHPIHFHLYDVQVINRVTWDNIIIPNDPNENGWKDTVRMSPLEDTIVAVRPIIPQVPFEVPNSVRPLNPSMPAGSEAGFFNTDPAGNPLATNITNQTINFGWEYVWHCHILSHEEMDMMRPVSLVMPPLKAGTLSTSLVSSRVQVKFNDNSITETRFALERTTNGTTWTEVASSPQPLGNTNAHAVGRTMTDTTSNATTAYLYRVVAENTVGYGSGMPSMTAKSTSDTVAANAPTAPTTLTATAAAGAGGRVQVNLGWTDTATTESGFVIQRSSDNGATFTQLAIAPAKTGTGAVTYTDTTVVSGTTYQYRVAAQSVAGNTAFTNTATVTATVSTPTVPAVPSILTGTSVRTSTTQTDTITWNAVSGATGYRIQYSLSSTFARNNTTVNVTAAPGVNSYSKTGLSRSVWYFRIASTNAAGTSSYSAGKSVPIAP